MRLWLPNSLMLLGITVFIVAKKEFWRSSLMKALWWKFEGGSSISNSEIKKQRATPDSKATVWIPKRRFCYAAPKAGIALHLKRSTSGKLWLDSQNTFCAGKSQSFRGRTVFVLDISKQFLSVGASCKQDGRVYLCYFAWRRRLGFQAKIT